MKDIEDRADLERLMTEFYSVAVFDPEIGHHFADMDLRSHLPVIIDFWEKNLFGVPVYFNNPLLVHQKLHERSPLTAEHFRRWVEIFGETIDRCFSGDTAELARSRAQAIADSLDQRLNGGIAITGRVNPKAISD
jgi:hemoglobin